MTPSQVLNALGQRLLAMTDCPPVVWLNKRPEVLPERPYLTVQIVRGSTRDPSLKGGSAKVSAGDLVVTVVHDLNIYTTQADTLAEQIAEHFGAVRRPEPGIVITDAPHVSSGYPTDTDWRVPVRVPWKTAR